MIAALVFIWIKWDILQVIKDITGMYGQKTNVLNRKQLKSRTSGSLKTVTSEIKLRPNEGKGNMNQHIRETETLQAFNDETTVLQDEGLEETTILTASNETTLLHDDSNNRHPVWLEPVKTIVVVHAETIEKKESETSEQAKYVRN